MGSENVFTSTCIENLTPAKLISDLEASSKFLSSDEDRPLTDFGFFEPTSPIAKQAHPSLITAFNGVYKLKRSTMIYSKEIRDRSLTMLIPTTGDRWPNLLDYFYDSNQTNGLYERFLYWVIGKKNFVQELSSLNDDLPPLEYLYITRLLIGARIYEYDVETLNYLRPILSDMRCNRTSCEALCNEACQRRGADLIERIAVIFQNIYDTLQVLQPIKSIKFNSIEQSTLNEIKLNIATVFYSNDNLTQSNDGSANPTGINLKNSSEVRITSVKKAPLQSMKIGLSAAKAAVHFFNKLLLPQSIQLFSTNSLDVKKMATNELKVIQHPLNCFSISDLTYNGIFHNFKRDNIDVKQVLLYLENKHFLKHGRFLKAGSRSIESWIKLLPEPKNFEQIQRFQSELSSSYQLGLEKYIDYYEHGTDNKSTLTEMSERILSEQRSLIDELRKEIRNTTVVEDSSESTNHLSTRMFQVEDISQDIIDVVADDVNDLQTACLITNESTDAIQQMNMSSINECHENTYMQNYQKMLDDYQFHDNVIHDCLYNVIERVAKLVDVADATMIVSTIDQNKTISSIEISAKIATSNDNMNIISDEMKALGKKILLSDTILLSKTKLNKVCKTNRDDIRKACQLLIDHELLSVEPKALGNKSSYFESYLKETPENKSQLVDFSLKLAKFGITDIDKYYVKLKKVDTQNNTYLTPYGHSIFQRKPYSNLDIEVDESAVIQPTKNRCHRLFDMSSDRRTSEIETSSLMETNEPANAEHESEPCTLPSKRRRGMTRKGKEYQEQQTRSKKKKDDH
ncbi:unnamed protein product [Rotaria sordida]|uniref:Uncharacterized protein n=1 Tax=Rotaria sordida TaxID=392033 RepID=A0A819EU61_9BILA|nr:unnamed protein product [Rotaria sordida]